METTDLAHQWDRLDKEYERQISLLCPHTADGNSPASHLLKSPLQHGGLDILNHKDIAPPMPERPT